VAVPWAELKGVALGRYQAQIVGGEGARAVAARAAAAWAVAALVGAAWAAVAATVEATAAETVVVAAIAVVADVLAAAVAEAAHALGLILIRTRMGTVGRLEGGWWALVRWMQRL